MKNRQKQKTEIQSGRLRKTDRNGKQKPNLVGYENRQKRTIETQSGRL